MGWAGARAWGRGEGGRHTHYCTRTRIRCGQAPAATRLGRHLISLLTAGSHLPKPARAKCAATSSQRQYQRVLLQPPARPQPPTHPASHTVSSPPHPARAHSRLSVLHHRGGIAGQEAFHCLAAAEPPAGQAVGAGGRRAAALGCGAEADAQDQGAPALAGHQLPGVVPALDQHRKGALQLAHHPHHQLRGAGGGGGGGALTYSRQRPPLAWWVPAGRVRSRSCAC